MRGSWAKPRALAICILSLAACPEPGAAQWITNGAIVSAAPGDQVDASAIADGAGGQIIVWSDWREESASDIYVQRILVSGERAWVGPTGSMDGIRVCGAPGLQESPRLVSDGAGGAIVVWQDSRGGDADIYVHRVLASGAVDPQWTPHGTRLSGATGVQDQPQITTDGSGGAIVVWRDQRFGGSDIYMHRVLASGTADPSWTADGTRLCGAPHAQENPRIVSDGAGGAFAVWQDSRNGLNHDVFAHHVTATGIADVGWATDGVPVGSAPGSQVDPVLVPDGAGGAIVAWQDSRNGNADIYAQRLLPSGAIGPGWVPNGTAICVAENFQYAPTLESDGAEGAIIAWHDYRGGDADIYAQRVTGSGTGAWTSNGVLLCGAPNNQLSPRITGDGSGGAVAAWTDFRSGAIPNIFAHHVGPSGLTDPTWPSDGLAICTATGFQLTASIVSDNAGAVIATWYDRRSGGGYDLYAQRVYAGNAPLNVGAAAVRRVELRVPRPNPVRAGAWIDFALPRPGRVSMGIHDVTGKLVRALAVDQDFTAGAHSVAWNGLVDSGRPASAGVYFVHVVFGGSRATRRLAFVP